MDGNSCNASVYLGAFPTFGYLLLGAYTAELLATTQLIVRSPVPAREGPPPLKPDHRSVSLCLIAWQALCPPHAQRQCPWCRPVDCMEFRAYAQPSQ
jgi:hypothetical protein